MSHRSICIIALFALSACGGDRNATDEVASRLAAHRQGDTTDTSDGLHYSQCAAILSRASQLVRSEAQAPNPRPVFLHANDIQCLSHELQLRDHVGQDGRPVPSPFQNLLAPLFAMAYQATGGNNGGGGGGGGGQPPQPVPTSGFYHRASGNFPCELASISFRTRAGALASASLRCTKGTLTEEIFYTCDAQGCSSGNHKIEIYDGEIDLVLGDKRGAFKFTKVLETGVYSKVSGSWSCQTVRIKDATPTYLALALEGNCSNSNIEFDCSGPTCRSRSYNVVITLNGQANFHWDENGQTAVFAKP